MRGRTASSVSGFLAEMGNPPPPPPVRDRCGWVGDLGFKGKPQGGGGAHHLTTLVAVFSRTSAHLLAAWQVRGGLLYPPPPPKSPLSPQHPPITAVMEMEAALGADVNIQWRSSSEPQAATGSNPTPLPPQPP